MKCFKIMNFSQIILKSFYIRCEGRKLVKKKFRNKQTMYSTLQIRQQK